MASAAPAADVNVNGKDGAMIMFRRADLTCLIVYP
jgi:hypothetical protein